MSVMCKLIGVVSMVTTTVTLMVILQAAVITCFSATSYTTLKPRLGISETLQLQATLRTNVELPLLDLMDTTSESKNDDDDGASFPNALIPLPSSNFPDQLATPFLYGLQINTPLHKLILDEATSMALTSAATAASSSSSSSTTSPQRRNRPMYGQLVWKDTDSNSLVGAIGCTAEILVNAPTRQAFEKDPQLAEELLGESSKKDNGG
ncbi:MAG: hypothetical protein SGILL_000449, partial [Bacillariaceae sp.]